MVYSRINKDGGSKDFSAPEGTAMSEDYRKEENSDGPNENGPGEAAGFRED
jgi:hypothetical protein